MLGIDFILRELTIRSKEPLIVLVSKKGYHTIQSC